MQQTLSGKTLFGKKPELVHQFVVRRTSTQEYHAGFRAGFKGKKVARDNPDYLRGYKNGLTRRGLDVK